MKEEEIIEAIYEAIDDLNPLLKQEQRLEKSTQTILFGPLGKLDSMGLVSLIVATEGKIEEKFNVRLVLADEKAMSQKNSPFLSIESLANYISKLLVNHRDGN